jgi:hypothetical protein
LATSLNLVHPDLDCAVPFAGFVSIAAGFVCPFAAFVEPFISNALTNTASVQAFLMNEFSLTGFALRISEFGQAIAASLSLFGGWIDR